MIYTVQPGQSALDVFTIAQRKVEETASERRYALQTLLDNAHLDLPDLMKLEEEAAAADERYQAAKEEFSKFAAFIEYAQALSVSLGQNSSMLRG